MHPSGFIDALIRTESSFSLLSVAMPPKRRSKRLNIGKTDYHTAAYRDLQRSNQSHRLTLKKNGQAVPLLTSTGGYNPVVANLKNPLPFNRIDKEYLNAYKKLVETEKSNTFTGSELMQMYRRHGLKCGCNNRVQEEWGLKNSPMMMAFQNEDGKIVPQSHMRWDETVGCICNNLNTKFVIDFNYKPVPGTVDDPVAMNIVVRAVKNQLRAARAWILLRMLEQEFKGEEVFRVAMKLYFCAKCCRITGKCNADQMKSHLSNTHGGSQKYKVCSIALFDSSFNWREAKLSDLARALSVYKFLSVTEVNIRKEIGKKPISSLHPYEKQFFDYKK